MAITQEQFKNMLIQPGHITEEAFERAVSIAKERHVSLEEQLISLGLITDYNLGKTIADTFEYTFCNLTTITIPEHFLEYIPEIVARAQRAIVYAEDEEVISVATTDPENLRFKKLLEKKFGKKVHFAYAAHGALKNALNLYKGDYQERIQELIRLGSSGSAEGVVVELVTLLLEYGYESKASDIHIEPLEEKIRIRFRIDGVLHEVATYPKSMHEQIVFRIKILSSLQTDERDKPQDGRFSHETLEYTFDVRVSVIPVTDGENVVMRILSSHIRQYTLESLGFSEEDYKKIRRALLQPHGMILSVGPTGSGKTTILYSIVEKLNTPKVNIMTIEDPVEYDIADVQQTQVNRSKDLLFSSGLRSIVRQDPDIIMVGEIRDEETADIAINAAMTGHLLLSTMHTNDAATTFPRLTEMGVESFLAASSVRMVVSLRLVRTICTHCKESYFLSDKEQALIESEPKIHNYIVEISGKKKLKDIRFYRGAGCKVCHQSGFKGRSAIFEVLEVSDAVRVLISKKASSDEIHHCAIEEGMKPLLYDGAVKALRGQTTITEVIKATYS